MEEGEDNSEPINQSPKLDTLHDSNSLEPGEVIDDKTPEKNNEELKEVEVGTPDNEQDNQIKKAESEIEIDNILSKKPVLGKEKAKQRLKVIGIQKKIQMESRKIRTPYKAKEVKAVSTSKKDKPITPHEKAKLTKEEIEKLKEKQDCALPCLYYDAAMIHHIRTECPDDLSVNSNKVETCLTSLDAIKNYEDREEINKTEKIFNRKRYNEGVNRVRRKLYLFDDTKAPFKGRDKNFRKLDRHFGNDIKYAKLTPKERDRHKGNKSFNRKIMEMRSRYYDEQKLPPPNRLPTDKLMYTKIKPSISYAFNPRITSCLIKPEIKIPEERENRKNVRDEDSVSEKKKRRKKSRSNKDKKIKNKNKKQLKEEDKEKGNKNKKPGETIGALSFHLEDFFRDEDDGDGFSLSKDDTSFAKEKETEPGDDEKVEQGKKSPDTDEYMANWEEEEEDFAPILLSKNLELKKLDTVTPYDDDREQMKQNSKDDHDGRIDDDNEDEENEEIRDGFSTPIFINPSPPADYIANMMKIGDPEVMPVTPPLAKMKETHSMVNFEPKPFRNELIEMNKLYEQFIQSVNESGVHLEHHPSGQDVLEMADSVSREKNFFDFDSLNLHKSVENDMFSSYSPKFPPVLLRSNSVSSSSSSSSSSSNSSSSSSSPSSSSPSPSPSHNNKQSHAELLEKEARELKERKEKIYKIGNVNIKYEDWKKMYALRKREKMLKGIHCDEMDEEDKEYLESLGKLVRCEKIIMMRKYGSEVFDEILNVESDDSGAEGTSNPSETFITGSDLPVSKQPDKNDKAKEEELNKIFDANRETIKLKIPTKTPKTANNLKVSNKEYDSEEEQDFTDKLLKTTKINSPVGGNTPPLLSPSTPPPPKPRSPPPTSSSSSSTSSSSSSPSPLSPSPVNNVEESERKSIERPVRRYSRSMSRSPELRRPYRKGRSLSVSPIRRRRSSTDRSRRPRKRPYSPPPKYFKRYDSKRRRGSISPLVRRRSRSRSPYNRRFSRSPPFRPPSPPPPRESRSPSVERIKSSRAESPTSLRRHYSWVDRNSSQYYSSSNNNGYYYPLSPTTASLGNESGNRSGHNSRSYPTYTNYSQYNTYSNDYMGSTMGEYANNYGNEYIGSEPMNSYSRIPVISSTTANYYYNEFGAEHVPQPTNIPTNNNTSNNKITQKEAASGKSTTVAVQKGNVLEIVPAPVIPKEKLVDESSSAVKEEEKVEKVEKAENLEKVENVEKIEKIDKVVKVEEGIPKESVFEIKKPEERRRRRRIQESWEDEVAKRHVISAVLRLNKEVDGSIRGILCNKVTPDVVPKQKKKVLFADGIPPGRSSSTSDEEESIIKARKCLKKRRRRGENKENESITQIDPMVLIKENKIDPELENAPPPAPPPGSPPPNLEQPILNRSSSPEQLLYFHYDSVVNSMYVSQISTPIPPRLLNRNMPPGLPTINHPIMNNFNMNCSAPNPRVNSFQKFNFPGHASMNKEAINQDPVKENDKVVVKPSSALSMPLREQLKVQSNSDSSKVSRPASILSHIVPAPKPTGVKISAESSLPAILRFSAFNQPPPRPNINLVRANFAVPPPNRPMLSHPAIPFGPQPPGGTANFNRNLPLPSFNPASPPPFRSSFSPVVTHDNTPAFSTASGMASSSSNFTQQDNNLLPPPFPPKPIPSAVGQRRSSPQQFHPNNSPLTQGSTSQPFHGNNNSNVRQLPPHFHMSGIPTMVPRPLPPRPSLPPRPPLPSVFNQRMCPPPNQPPLNMPNFPTRPMFQLPGGVHHFLRTENMMQRPSPNITPPQAPPNVSPLVRHQGVNNL